MPLSQDELLKLQSFVQQNQQANKPPADFGVPKAKTPDEQINMMPNANKLTAGERYIYKKLPGVTTWMENKNLMGRSVSEQLDRFNNSWAGKALNKLDFLAEGLERTSGLVQQIATDPDFDFDELKAAWYAGSLTYDTNNLPGIKRDENGKIIGLAIGTDLPGSGGMHAHREKIQTYLNQGMTPQDALKKAHEEYYGGLGALALRAQMNDMWGHVLGDPLNLVTAYLKPVQALKARRFMALTTKITGGVDEFITGANKAQDLLKLAGNTEDALKYADEAFQFAQLSGDTKRATELAQQASEVAKGAGKLEDAQRYADEAARFAGMAPEEAAQFSEDALRAIGKKQLNSVDKFAIMMTGGDPFRPSALGKKFEKIPVLGGVAKLFQLTPESKAKEVLSLVSDNISSNVISRMMNNPNAEAEFVSYMRRVGKGATGIEYGHSMMTLEGRTVQGFIKGVENDIERMFGQYTELAPVRGKLDILAQAVGESPTKMLKMMDENPDAVLQMLNKHAGMNPTLAAMMQSGELSADSLKSIPKMLGDMPYNKEMFFAQAMDAIETAAMRQAVVQFGVKAKGAMTRWAEAIKSAESLAFLKLNPGYPIRNAINNEATMISRGLFGHMNDAGVNKFWDDFGGEGFRPKRLGDEGLSADIAGKKSKMSEADRILDETLKGGNYTAADKAKDFFSNIKLGKLDFAGTWGQKFENYGSRKAFTLGTQQFLRRLYKPKAAREYINPKLLDEIANVSPEFEKQLNNAIRASGAMEKKFDELLGTNLNLNTDSILDDVTESLGTDVRQMLGDEVLEHIHQGLPDAIAKGKVDGFIQEVRQTINNHIDDLFNKQLENVVEHTKAQAAAGGPNMWNTKLGEAQDLFWGAHIEYSMRMPEATRLAREASNAKDFAAARALWQKEAQDAAQFYNRAFRRVDAYIEGLEQGTKHLAERGVKLPFAQTKKTFREWKGMWEDFHKTANKLKDDFFENPKGKKFDDVLTQIDEMYKKAGKDENAFMQQLDDSIAAMIPDEAARAAYMNARDTLAEMKQADKLNVANIRKEIADLPKEERQARWNQFWQERAAKYQEMRQVDAASIAIQQGDPQAAAMFEAIEDTSRTAARKEFDAKQILEETRGAPGFSERTIEAGGNQYIVERSGTNVNAFIKSGDDVQPVKLSEMPDEVKAALDELKASLPKTEGMGLKEKNAANKKYLDEVGDTAYFEGIEAQKAAQAQPKQPQGIQPNFIADVNKVIPNPAPIDFSLDLMAYGRQYGALDEIVNGAKAAAKKQPTLLGDLPQNLQDEVRKSVQLIKNDFSSTRHQAMKFGEWRRDSALLNYNRRTNFDNYLGHVAPFVFWSTSSMFQWAVESIDRPAMFTNYLRAKKFLATNGMERDGMASRTKGKIRIDLPFAPDWMGEAFVDPLRLALPFDNWAAPFEQAAKDREGAAGRTTRVLDQMLAEGTITQDEYDMAVESREGSTWDYAEAQMAMNDQSDRYDAWDFGTAMASPHAPIMWAYNAAFGDKEDIGPFSPLSRMARNAATMLGVEDWNNSKWNLEAKIRRQMGLNSYDKWDDYRIKRAAGNLAGEGKFTPDEMKEAIAMAAMVEGGRISADDAKKQSEAYRMAVARSNDEFTGGGAQFGLGLLGISVTSVPQGENNLRALQDDFGNAYGKYKAANDSLEEYLAAHPNMSEEDAAAAWEKANPKLAKDGDALTEFMNEHPEYEGRLGLFDDPEVTVQKFMVDEIWKKFNEMPKVNQDEIREHLGNEFQSAFMDKATRNYDAVPVETMAVWLKMMGTDPLGGLKADHRLLVSLYGTVQYTDPETANRVQVFYDNRKQNFPDFYKQQAAYYELPKADRKKYMSQHPELKQYFDFRQNFMRDNPDLVPYLTDNQKAIDKAKNQTRSPEAAIPTAQELRVQLSPQVQEVMSYYFQQGTPIPPVLMNELDYIGAQSGISGDQLLNIYGGGVYQQP